MNIYQRIIIILGAIAMLIFHFSISIAIVFDCKEHGFTITLPDNWIEIPQDIIAQFLEETLKEVPEMPIQHYNYGYQPSENKYWLEYPYILIKIDEEGRITESQLEKFEKINFSKIVKELGNKMKNLASNLALNEMVYDSSNHIIWMKGQANIVYEGLIKILNGAIPTEKGLIQILCYAKEKDYNKYEPFFINIIKSVNVNKSIEYKKQFNEYMQPRKEILNRVIDKFYTGIVLGIAFGVIILFIYFIKWLLNSEKRRIKKEINKTKTKLYDNESKKYFYVCSECSARISVDDKYCKNCGADISKIKNKEHKTDNQSF